ncbi:MAG: glycosyl hydrolase [Candidatus Methylomirabilales bacterium]
MATPRSGAARRAKAEGSGVALLVATRKGAFVLRGDAARRRWAIEGPHFLGNETNHLVQDPRDARVWLLAAKTGHLGPTVFRSMDGGRTWKEATRPPAFPKAPAGQDGPAVDRVFYLAPGHGGQPGVWWAGSVPHAIFRSEDGGETWEHVAAFTDYLAGLRAAHDRFFPTPGGAITHSILVDPREAGHMYVSLSTGGSFETGDGGATWRPLNEGVAADFIPEPDPEYGHDPHRMVLHPVRPDRLYQQNHCGVYRLDRPGTRWERIGKALPAEVGDIGFPIAAHPRNPDTLWVFPMDATSVWPRTSPGGRPAAFCSRDGGRTWTRQAKGLPESHAWLTVLRQAMVCDTRDPVGVYVGTTAGEVWASSDEGESWRCVASHLPPVLAVEAAER